MSKARAVILIFVLVLFAISMYLISKKMYESIRPVKKTVTRSTTFDLFPRSINGSNAFENVRMIVNIGPRISGTEGAAKAADLIADQLKKMGYTPVIDTFEDQTPDGAVTFRNILAETRLTGKRIVVIVSHYDTKSGIGPEFVGANDSGSSSGLLLEIARVLSTDKRNSFDVVLAFVDGEECRAEYNSHDGLHGSKRLTGHLIKTYGKDRIAGAIVIDMIGDKDLSIAIPDNSSSHLISTAFDAGSFEDFRNNLSMSSPIIDDHVPFIELGIPAVDLIDFNYGSGPGLNDYWHTEKDTLDKLGPASLEVTGRIVIRMINVIRSM